MKNRKNMVPTSENQKYLSLVNNDKQHQHTLILKIKISFGRKLKDVIEKIQECLKNKPASAFVHVGTNDMKSDDNLLTGVRKICHKAKETSLNTPAVFSSIFTEAHSKLNIQTSKTK